LWQAWLDLPGAWVDQAVTLGRHERPPCANFRYVAAVDPSGGGADAFTLAIVPAEGKEYESANLEAIVKEIAGICKRYRLSSVTGDRYAAAWVRERFRAEGIRYEEPEAKVLNEPETTRCLDKSLAYLEIEPLFAQGRIELLDHPELARELKFLERLSRTGGRTLVDRAAGGHDDHANALALAATLAAATHVRPFGRAVLPPGVDSVGSPGEGSRITPGPRLGGQATWVRGWFDRLR
jgi:hypothetical protein